MNSALCMVVVVLLGLSPTAGARERDATASPALGAPADVRDFATTVLNINKIGQFVCNQGRFYPGSGEIGVTGEWPIGSGHEQMYRMNVFVGIPGNVVQSRVARTREWNPLPGYHNPDLGRLAVSNDPSTWPRRNGEPYWPVRDAQGNPRIISMQDSYGVYDDGNNYLAQTDTTKFLRVEVHQSSYAWNTVLDEDYIVFQFDLVNNGAPRESLYFCHYTDFDCGGWRGTVEYADDILVFERDRQFYYQFDADNQTTNWEGPPFYIGVVFLSTPEVNGSPLGITDFHYTSDASEPLGDINDRELFWYMSSDPRLKADEGNWPDLFHGDDLHFDDTSLIPPTGREITVFASSGPYSMATGDTLRFIVAMVAGADYGEISANVDRIWEVFRNDWRVKFVPQPIVTAVAGDGMVSLRWDNRIDESYIDIYTGRNTLAQYRIYKTTDPRRLTWTLYDSVAVGQYVSGSSMYEWIDRAVDNGFYYSYAVTAMDSSGAESGIAVLSDRTTTVEVRPSWAPSTRLDAIRVVPNPFIISARWERERLGNIPEGEPIRELAFVNLPAECTIKIFTIDGDLVRTIRHTNGAGTEYWDLRSEYNRLVATGVYVFHVESSHGEHVGKFAIVR